eukprot:TRINITY_DN54346_c0_g1_i1.p1 TRINITY_DN54346_c0_g1~~TRINITY_DN54346_c0_g1_i1.p1  ORF type:complete len:102 (+),score=24.48 TRINITY_DN54346_c0_g1_i1:98-403(+)
MCIRDRFTATNIFAGGTEDQKMLLVQMGVLQLIVQWLKHSNAGDFQILCNCLEGIENILQCEFGPSCACLLYTSDAADEEDSVDLGGRRIIKKKKKRRMRR